MPACFFASDLHGNTSRYEALFRHIEDEAPAAVFLGGDLLPLAMHMGAAGDHDSDDFIAGFLRDGFAGVRDTLKGDYPRVFLIPGNDDPRAEEGAFRELEREGLFEYIPQKSVSWQDYWIWGYPYVPPTPFQLKDWEKYDVSRFVDPGCVSPEDGRRSVPVDARVSRWSTIQEDLHEISQSIDPARAILLFHTPPYRSKLDRAALDDVVVDHVPMDVHVGSIALRRFIEAEQPLLTMHGHVHESSRLTGSWRDRIGTTHCFSGAVELPELALVRFNPARLDEATRTLY